MILLYYNALYIWFSTLLQLAITLSSFQARQQEGLRTNSMKIAPSNPEAERGHLILVLCHFCRTVPLITYLQLLLIAEVS